MEEAFARTPLTSLLGETHHSVLGIRSNAGALEREESSYHYVPEDLGVIGNKECKGGALCGAFAPDSAKARHLALPLHSYSMARGGGMSVSEKSGF